MINKDFVLAGQAVFTVEIPGDRVSLFNKHTHYTYRVELVEGNDRYPTSYFVHILTDGTKWIYLGKLNPTTGEVFTTKASKLSKDSDPFRLLSRVLARIWAREEAAIVQAGFDVHHEGKCGRCGNPLTRPDSIELGLGPVCAKKIYSAAQF